MGSKWIGFEPTTKCAERPKNAMLFSQKTFIGIDPAASPRPVVFAAINRDLNLLSLRSEPLEEIHAYLGGQECAMIAICGPSSPNQGLMKREAVRQALNPPPNPGRWMGFRVVEYQLAQHNIRMPRTHANADNCPGWMRTSFELYRQAEGLGYQSYPADEETSLQMMEVYPHATFSTLLGVLPFPKHSLEGRLQRQLALFHAGLNIPDPMRVFEEITRHRLMTGVLPLEGLYTSAQLDALSAAYTAWMAAARPEKITQLGDPEEGQILLPAAELQSKY
ncbi:MAG: DUF429 domain-containing protein [Chloroflexota bacterium]